jgi:hypothetical protein
VTVYLGEDPGTGRVSFSYADPGHSDPGMSHSGENFTYFYRAVNAEKEREAEDVTAQSQSYGMPRGNEIYW